jgi:prepilin signal peptidase PulO-like enzyme (type II secretory pathway)
MNLFFGIFIFIFGTCWGSFANVLIDGTENKKSIKGRSKCDFCGYQLNWLDNIPILSFLFLKGRCRKCHKKLSWQYPLVEFLTGVVFLTTFVVLQGTNLFETNSLSLSNYLNLIYYLGVVYLLWIILVWDFKYMIIPDFLIITGIIATLIYQLYRIAFLDSNWLFLGELFLGGLLLGGFFGILYWFSKGKWIGGGDVKLGFWLGLLLGYKLIYFLLLIAYTSGALVALGFLFLGSKKMKSEIPFGPFLVLATYLVIFYQDFILKIWYSLI